MFTPRITLEQWRALVAVVEAGGYAQAAMRLNKTQSAVSYAVQQIEERLGLTVFTLEGRKARLTQAGQVLYLRGLSLVREAERLEQTAENLAGGQEAVLRLAVEAIFPTWLLLSCLRQFAERQPETRVELHELVINGIDELMLDDRLDLAICSQVPPGMIGDPLLPVRFVAAAAPDHPLHRLERELCMADLREHRHLIVRQTGSGQPVEGAWRVSDQRWTFSNAATSIRAGVMGLGFAWYPEELIREELDAGRLKPLPLREGRQRWGWLHLVRTDPDGTGPGVRHLEELLREAVQCCQSVAARTPECLS